MWRGFKPKQSRHIRFRTDNTVGGYENLANDWGSYKITGGEIRYDGTRTRVERFFKTISQGTTKKTILTGTLKIIDLSDGNTCIIQSHAGGDILKSEESGSENKSAQFLVYAKKKGDSQNTIRNSSYYRTSLNEIWHLLYKWCWRYKCPYRI